MIAALIPPIPELQRYGDGEFHLLLSHLMSDSRYKSWYLGQRMKGAYLVLDNSAHEFKTGQKAEELRDQAGEIAAQEVVVPDMLFDGMGTVSLAVDTLELWYEGDDVRMTLLNPALMYVPQGRDEEEWVWCMYELIRLHSYMTSRVSSFRPHFVLGVSKDYHDPALVPGGLPHLLRKYVLPAREGLWREREIKMHVHLLGWVRALWDLQEFAREFPWLRSTDSAKPFVYAMNGTTLNPDRGTPEYPTRPEDYFTRELTPQERKAATRNSKTFRRLAL